MSTLDIAILEGMPSKFGVIDAAVPEKWAGYPTTHLCFVSWDHVNNTRAAEANGEFTRLIQMHTFQRQLGGASLIILNEDNCLGLPWNCKQGIGALARIYKWAVPPKNIEELVALLVGMNSMMPIVSYSSTKENQMCRHDPWKSKEEVVTDKAPTPTTVDGATVISEATAYDVQKHPAWSIITRSLLMTAMLRHGYATRPEMTTIEQRVLEHSYLIHDGVLMFRELDDENRATLRVSMSLNEPDIRNYHPQDDFNNWRTILDTVLQLHNADTSPTINNHVAPLL